MGLARKRIVRVIFVVSVLLLILGPTLLRFKEAFIAKHNVYFLKTHKTGSCTVQNILYRFGDTRRLNFALGAENINFQFPNKIRRRFLLPIDLSKTVTGEYNILCNHARFDYNGAMTFMPKDTIFITIVRDPATAFLSRLRYEPEVYRPCFGLYSDNVGAEFANKMASYYPVRHLRPMCAGGSPSHNALVFDMGLDLKEVDNADLVVKKITEINDIFSLVMIMEYFDESLVLLRHLLNWDLVDIAYLRHNVMKKTKTAKPQSPEMLEKIRQWNSADTAVYNFFNASFWKKAEHFGLDKLAAEVKDLRTLNAKYYHECVQLEVPGGRTDILQKSNLPYHDQAMAYVLRKHAKASELCTQLTRTEIPYFNLLYERMAGLAFAVTVCGRGTRLRGPRQSPGGESVSSMNKVCALLIESTQNDLEEGTTRKGSRKRTG